MKKIHLGKTAASRSRKKKIIEEISSKIKLPQGGFTDYLLQKNYSGTTITGCLGEVKKFKSWLAKENMEIENAGYNDITAYLQSFGNVTQHTKGCYLRGVKHYFNYLIQNGSCTDNPAAFIQLRGMKRKTLHDILNRQQLDALYGSYVIADEINDKHKNQNWFKTKVMIQKRNKAILGLMLFQSLDTRHLKLLSVNDVKLREGKIYIPGMRRSNERTLKLEALQIIDLMEYMHAARKELLELTGKETEKLFINSGTSETFSNIMVYLIRTLKRVNQKVTSSKQLRASVIVHWLKLYNLREVQYMAGHRYVSSTESFLVNAMDEMIEDIEKYHPIV